MAPPKFPDEPPSEPPYLNPTASWYSGDAWFLFVNIVENCGYPTAKFIFEKCMKDGAEIEAQNEKRATIAQRRAIAPPIKLPTIEQINAADRHQICVWWARLRGTDQDFSVDEKQIIGHLAGRYVEVGGYTKDFDETKLPPIPQKRNHDDAILVAMFDRTNPESAYSIARAERGGQLKVSEFAASLVPKWGNSAGHVIRKVKFARTGR